MSIEVEINKLLGMLNIYSDCENCGVVTSDPDLLKPDPWNRGRFKSLCPSCKRETWRSPLISQRLNEVFEMMVQCAEIDRPILVLTLACTIYESMVYNFTYRLLEKENCSVDVCVFVSDSLDFRGSIKLIESMTSKDIKKLAKTLGFESLSKTYQEINQKRNSFLHTAYSGDLNEKDSIQGLQFAQNLILFFADLYTRYGKRTVYGEY